MRSTLLLAGNWRRGKWVRLDDCPAAAAEGVAVSYIDVDWPAPLLCTLVAEEDEGEKE